ncbi:uncharacterized protein [Asterias amurensis]|uniref:uncharacterized protein n=1 Tax=Asterias amurensis TaxID=7602 RepID=UPI003AB66F61
MQFLRVCRICLQLHVQKSRVMQQQFSSGNSTKYAKHLSSKLVTPRVQFRLRNIHISNAFRWVKQQSFSSSSLYTPTSEGDHVPFILNPEIEFKRLFSDLSELERNVSARGQKVNLTNLVLLWKELQLFEQDKIRIEGEKSEVNKRSKQLNKSGKGTKEQKDELQQLGRTLRENVRLINKSIATLSDEFYPAALKLPNDLHPDVPRGSTPKVLETFGADKQEESTADKSTGWTSNELIQESLPTVHAGSAFLNHEAALMELALMQWASQELIQQGFVPFSCPAMFKSIALEAIGLNPDSSNEIYAIETQENVQYLTGASPMAFIAYYMMSVMEMEDLPYRGFTVGRSYDSLKDSDKFDGLHNNFQTQKVELCGVCENSDIASNALFTQFLRTATDLLVKLPLHYRLTSVPSARLLPSMHLKYAIEVWIPNIAEFVEVGCAYSCTDYISRRVKMRYPAIPTQSAAQSRQRNFLHTVHCTALDTSVLLAALLPAQQVPDVLERHMPQSQT